jgi:hypothetical protein
MEDDGKHTVKEWSVSREPRFHCKWLRLPKRFSLKYQVLYHGCKVSQFLT